MTTVDPRPRWLSGAAQPMAAPEALAAVDAILTDPQQLELVVQPLVGLTDGQVVGYEALTRLPASWDVAPGPFFAAATARGVHGAMARLVLQRALALRDQLPPRCFLTVNVTPLELVTTEVATLLASANLSRLVIELTETAWPDDESAVLQTVDLIRERGGMLAADDVGAGYAGLLQLVRLRPNMVKVDRKLVTLLGEDPAAEAVLRMLGELVSVLDAWLLVEGVETADQLASVMRLDIPIAQGWYLGGPASPWPTGNNLDVVRRAARRGQSTDHLAAHWRTERPGEVRCDPWGRPRQVRVDIGAGRESIWLPAMTLDSATPVANALSRAMSRVDPVARFAPLCVTDETGRLVGVVPVHELALAVANTGSPGR